MTDTGQVPGEGQPENAGGHPGQPQPAAAPSPADAGPPYAPGTVTPPETYPYLDPADPAGEDDDLLLMPGAQGAWSEPQAQQPLPQPHDGPQGAAPQAPQPDPQPTPAAGFEPMPAQAGDHESGGRDSGSVDLGAVRIPQPVAPQQQERTPAAAQSAPARRPLHMGPPVPEATGGVVRSLADRGPAGAPAQAAARHAGPPPAGPENPDTSAEPPTGPQQSAAAQAPASAQPAPGEPAAGAPVRETAYAEQPPAAPSYADRPYDGQLYAEQSYGATGQGRLPGPQLGEIPTQMPPWGEASAQAVAAPAADVAASTGPAAQSPAAPVAEAAQETPQPVIEQPQAQPMPQPADDLPEGAAAESPAEAPADVPAVSPVAPVVSAPEAAVSEAQVPEASAPDAPVADDTPAADAPVAPQPPEALAEAPQQSADQPVEPVVDQAADASPSAPLEQLPAVVAEAPDESEPAEDPAAAEQHTPAEQEPEGQDQGQDQQFADPVAEPVAPVEPAEPVQAVPAEEAEARADVVASDAATEITEQPAAAQAEADAPSLSPSPADGDEAGQDAQNTQDTQDTQGVQVPEGTPREQAVIEQPEAQQPDVSAAPEAPEVAPETAPEAPAGQQPAASGSTDPGATPYVQADPALPVEPSDAADTPAVPAEEPAEATAEAGPEAEAEQPAAAEQSAPAEQPDPQPAAILIPAQPTGEHLPGEAPEAPDADVPPQQDGAELVQLGEGQDAADDEGTPAAASTGPEGFEGADAAEGPAGAPGDIPADDAAPADFTSDEAGVPVHAVLPTQPQHQDGLFVDDLTHPSGVPIPAPAAGYDDSERAAVHRVMRERRDIRNGFRSDPIPNDVLLRVLEAAHTAPSVGHSQPWDFVVIRSDETRERMHQLATEQRDAYAKSLPKARAKQFRELKIEAILETPVNIVVTADSTRGGRHTLGRHTQPQMAPYSSALAVENLWLAARAEGLGVGWVSFFDEREMVRELGLPDHLEVVAYLCVGYVDEFPEEPELLQAGWSKRRPLSWVVHEETYGRRALPGEDPHDLLQETLQGIRPLDAKALGEAWERQKRMTKPAGALGMLEIISAQLSGLSRKCPPPIPEPAAVAIFAGDHGVHAQGVTPWPQEVTGQMVANFLGGGAVCNAFANQVGAEVCVVDVGVACELPATPGLLPRKVRPGTADFTVGPAMSHEDVLKAIEVGIETARDLVAAGNKALLTGEMGIANTTTSAALIAVYTGVDPVEVTGRGTGINDETHARKVDVVRRGLELHQPDPADPIGVLAAVGGLEHAALVGLILGGASLRTPVILDGVSAGAAALVARAIAPEALAACIAGHRSAEPGHVAALTKLGLRPLVDLDLRLGEGTGALLALPVVQSAARAMHEVATFDSAGVTEKN